MPVLVFLLFAPACSRANDPEWEVSYREQANVQWDALSTKDVEGFCGEIASASDDDLRHLMFASAQEGSLLRDVLDDHLIKPTQELADRAVELNIAAATDFCDL